MKLLIDVDIMRTALRNLDRAHEAFNMSDVPEVKKAMDVLWEHVITGDHHEGGRMRLLIDADIDTDDIPILEEAYFACLMVEGRQFDINDIRIIPEEDA